MTEYWAAVYAREKTYGGSDLRWRMRDTKEHPCDPGWERGDCSVCHYPIREQAEAGDLLFDIVFPQGAKSNASRVVRSVMPITQAESDKLEFDFYFFLDGDWRDGIAASEGEVESWLDGAALWRGRGTLSESTAMDWLEMLTNGEAYTTYKVGQRPQSIPDEHWRHMIRRCSLTSSEVTEAECSSPSNEGKGNQSETDQTGIC